jgi:hypothetical protein
MVSRGSIRALGVSLAALLLVFVGVSTVSAAASCSVTVSPATGTAGTVFTFNGKGFKPTELTLHKDDAQASDHKLGSMSDPWTLAVRSRPGDEGKWSAEFSSAQCTSAASFTVTLSNTDVAPATVASVASHGGAVPLSLAGLVLAAGATGGLFLGRRLRAGSADNRPQ